LEAVDTACLPLSTRSFAVSIQSKKKILIKLWIPRNILPLTTVAAFSAAATVASFASPTFSATTSAAAVTFSFASAAACDANATPCSTFSVTTAAPVTTACCAASSASDPFSATTFFISSNFSSP